MSQEKETGNINKRNIIYIQALFLLFLLAFYSYNRIFPTFEIVLLSVAIMLLWRSEQRKLLIHLLPFLIILISYQSLRGFADDLSPADIHITDLIAYEKFLFAGTIPAYFIQSRLFGTVVEPIVASLSSFFYMSHFLTPVFIAIIIWYQKRENYWPYVGGLVILSFAGFFTYLFYPAAPPWWATEYGYLVDQPVIVHEYGFYYAIQFASPNPVAAMPSLHMAYPVYIASFCIFIWGKKVVWIILLPLIIGFATLFLGHHYVVDLIAGALYGILSFLGIWIWLRFVRKPKAIN